MDAIVSAAWLLSEAGQPDLRVVDATLFLPDHGRDALAEYWQAHIPGAVFFDQETVSDPDSGLPHTLPKPDHFASCMEQLGIGVNDRIIVYDNSPLKTAARVWWMFRLYGARRAAVLDGGLAAWKAAGGALESGMRQPAPCRFQAEADFAPVRSLDDMLANVQQPEVQVVDARSAGRFAGTDPEPRPGMRGGHIPGARNLPIAMLYAPDGRLKDKAGLRAAFAEAGVDPMRPFIATCGSGVTAACIVHAATILGARDSAIYDGSWSEWGARKDTPVATGA